MVLSVGSNGIAVSIIAKRRTKNKRRRANFIRSLWIASRPRAKRFRTAKERVSVTRSLPIPLSLKYAGRNLSGMSELCFDDRLVVFDVLRQRGDSFVFPAGGGK